MNGAFKTAWLLTATFWVGHAYAQSEPNPKLELLVVPGQGYEAALDTWSNVLRETGYKWALANTMPDKPGAAFDLSKAKGTFQVIGTVNIDNLPVARVKGELPIEQDLATLGAIYPLLREKFYDPTAPESAKLEALSSVYCSLRFDSLEVDWKEGEDVIHFKPVAKEAVTTSFANMRYVEIASSPNQATIRVKGYFGWGKTDDQGYLPIGDAIIQLSKDGYEPLEELRSVEDKKQNRFNFVLKKK